MYSFYTPPFSPKAYFKNVDWINLFHVQVQKLRPTFLKVYNWIYPLPPSVRTLCTLAKMLKIMDDPLVIFINKAYAKSYVASYKQIHIFIRGSCLN